MDRRSNIYIIIFSILFVVTIVSGITLAIYTWQTISEDEDVIEGESSCFNVIYVKGNNIGSDQGSETLYLGKNHGDGLSTTMNIRIDSECVGISGLGTIYLNTDEETSDYLINSGLLNYRITVNGSLAKTGIINSKSSMPIYENFSVDYNNKNITVYVWLNGENVTNDNVEEVMNSIYKGNINVRVESR